MIIYNPTKGLAVKSNGVNVNVCLIVIYPNFWSQWTGFKMLTMHLKYRKETYQFIFFYLHFLIYLHCYPFESCSVTKICQKL